MTKSTFTISDTAINNITACEDNIGTLKTNNKQNNQVANRHKMQAYGELIASVAHEKQTKQGFTKETSKKLYDVLQNDVGVNHATAKRYVEGSAGAVRLIKQEIGDIPTQYTPDAVVNDLLAMEIDSENKLLKACSGEADKSKARKIAESAIGKWSTKKEEDGRGGYRKVQGDKFIDGLNDEELDEFFDHVRELQAAREAFRNAEAAKVAEAEAAQENVEVNTSVDALLGDAA